jgi:hypothetical protein
MAIGKPEAAGAAPAPWGPHAARRVGWGVQAEAQRRMAAGRVSCFAMECRTRPPQRGGASTGRNIPGRRCGQTAEASADPARSSHRQRSRGERAVEQAGGVAGEPSASPGLDVGEREVVALVKQRGPVRAGTVAVEAVADVEGPWMPAFAEAVVGVEGTDRGPGQHGQDLDAGEVEIPPTALRASVIGRSRMRATATAVSHTARGEVMRRRACCSRTPRARASASSGRMAMSAEASTNIGRPLSHARTAHR